MRKLVVNRSGQNQLYCAHRFVYPGISARKARDCGVDGAERRVNLGTLVVWPRRGDPFFLFNTDDGQGCLRLCLKKAWVLCWSQKMHVSTLDIAGAFCGPPRSASVRCSTPPAEIEATCTRLSTSIGRETSPSLSAVSWLATWDPDKACRSFLS